MNRRSLRTLVLAVLLVALAGCAMLAQSDIAIIRSMWGTRMTAAEFLQKVNPEFLASLPARCREAADTVDVQWGGESAVMTSIRNVSTSDLTDALAPASQTPRQDVARYIIVVECTNRLDFSGTTASFGASSTVWEPLFLRMPFMPVYSQLLRDGYAIAARTSSKYNVWRVTASGSYAGCPPGMYQNIGYHYVEFPPGSTPRYGFQVTESDLWEVPG